MAFQSNQNFENRKTTNSGYKLSLLDAFVSIKNLFVRKNKQTKNLE